jgi:hypothetical protein
MANFFGINPSSEEYGLGMKKVLYYAILVVLFLFALSNIFAGYFFDALFWVALSAFFWWLENFAPKLIKPKEKKMAG